jgi:hypothetical protein
MLENYYLSHWDTKGLKPYMRYTLAGGYGGESENCAYFGWYDSSANPSRYARLDLQETLRQLQHAMMYDDAESDWGHRDTILDRWSNKVNIGIAYDEHRMALVQQFEWDYIRFREPPAIVGPMFSMFGRSTMGGLEAVAVYYEPLPRPLTQQDLLQGPHSYSLGNDVTYILPPSYYTETAPYIQASTWDTDPNGSFAIEADIGPLVARGSGVYTVVAMARAQGELVRLTTYSIFIQ